MTQAAAARARRQASLYYARERRRSLLSDARLFRTASLEVDDTLDLSVVFPNPLAPVTFEGLIAIGSGPASVFLNTGELTFETVPTGLKVSIGSWSETVVLPETRRIRYNLAVRPGDAQVRLWVGSQRAIAVQVGTAPLPWHSNGTLGYTDTASIALRSPLSIYYLQRPRHFGDAEEVIPGDVSNDLLLRAAIATFMTGEFPFIGPGD